jgi:hypothetical protein
MDLQKQIAERRAQLAVEEAKRKQAETAAEASRQAQTKKQKAKAVEELAADLSTDQVKVKVDGDELDMEPVSLSAGDVEGLKDSKIAALLKREARKRWTPGQNWQVISLIAGGVCLLHLGGFGLIPLAIGLWRRSVVNKRHREALLEQYPEVFNAWKPAGSY